MTEQRVTTPAQKRIALIAHDHKKDAIVQWCRQNKEVLARHFLCGTGTTARLIADQTGLPVEALKSGPLGGDQEVGARIAEGQIDMVIFLSDPLEAQPHDPDIKALLRIANVYDIPFANNRATADYLVTSPYMNSEHERSVEDYSRINTRRLNAIEREMNDRDS